MNPDPFAHNAYLDPTHAGPSLIALFPPPAA